MPLFPGHFFATLTNVNFDDSRIIQLAREAEQARDWFRNAYENKCFADNRQPEVLAGPALFSLAEDKTGLLLQAPELLPNRGKEKVNDDVIGLRLLNLYGLKGAAAYMEHARVLGEWDDSISAEFHKHMAWLGSDPDDMQALLDNAMAIGLLNYRIMEMLDRGETMTFGHPAPTRVNTRPVAGKAILVSGHDLIDLEHILEQTMGKGINIYTNGEMLPAHAYPQLNKYPHLVGNYGSAWQNQQREFAEFPGAIVMTSNCIIDPNVGNYGDRIFTRNIVGWPGVQHLEGHDFTQVIEKALALPGFERDEIPHYITTGFARNALMEAAPAVIEKVKSGDIKHFFLIGGCDGDKAERTYFRDMAESVPQDSLILTLACGKYKFNKLDFGEIDGIPRLLDVGQCNDAYSAIQLALALASEFECGVNELPLTLVLSWFEQKAIVILLTLLALGVKNIYTGPTAPAFLTDNLLAILTDQFQLKLTSTVENDLKQILQAA